MQFHDYLSRNFTGNFDAASIAHVDVTGGRRFLESPTAVPQQRKQPEVTFGSKLLCVDDQNLRRHYTPGIPVHGHLYCVRELYRENGIPGVLLVGITGPTNRAGLECGFLLSRFRWVHD
jgi:hypothetical protein